MAEESRPFALIPQSLELIETQSRSAGVELCNFLYGPESC